MAATKKRKPTPTPVTEGQFTLVLEDLRSQFAVFGEALQGLREHMDRRLDAVEGRLEAVEGRLDAVEGELGLLKDAVRTHSRVLQRIETKVDQHETRISKLEGAAE